MGPGLIDAMEGWAAAVKDARGYDRGREEDTELTRGVVKAPTPTPFSSAVHSRHKHRREGRSE